MTGSSDRTALRENVVVVVGTTVMAGVIALSIQLGRDTPVMLASPLLLVLLMFAGYVVLRACTGAGWAMTLFFVVLVFINDGLFRVREPGDIGLDWQNAMKLALWGSALLIGVCHLPRTWPLLRSGAHLWLFAYLGFAWLSCVYSASSSYSLGTVIGVTGMPLFGAALVSIVDEKRILLAFLLSLLVFIVLGWGAYYALPELGRSLFITNDGSVVERLCGLAGQANALGNVLAVFLACVFLLVYRGHLSVWLAAPLGAFGMFTLLVADSRTAFLAFLIGAIAVVLRRSTWLWGSAFLCGTLLTLFAMTVPLREVMNLSGGLSRSGDPTELFTLTGRTEIWQFAWEKIVLNPWIGYGYNSSKFILPEFDGLPGLKIDEAHNMLLQNLLAVGAIGTLPLIGFALQLLVEFVRRPYCGRDLLAFMMLVWGITVAGPFGCTATVMTMLISIVLAQARHARLALGPASCPRERPVPLMAAAPFSKLALPRPS